MKKDIYLCLFLVLIFVSFAYADQYNYFDNFEDASVNKTIWTNYTNADASLGGSASATVDEIAGTDGYYYLYSTGTVDGAGHSISALSVARNKINYKTGKSYIFYIAANITQSGGSFGIINQIEFNEGTTLGLGDVNTASPAGTVAVLDFNSIVKSNFYMILNSNGTINLYDNNNTRLASVAVNSLTSWYPQFRASFADSMAGETTISKWYIYNFNSSDYGVVLNSPSVIGSNVFNFSWNVESNSTVQNATLYLWDSTGALTKTSIDTSGVTNATTITTSALTIGSSYTWNIMLCGSFQFNCTFSPSNNTFKYGASLNAVTYNSSTYETAKESFTLNLTLASGVTSSSAVLYYNNVSKGTSTKTTTGGNTIFTNTFDIPNDYNRSNFYWALNLNGVLVNTTEYTQNISQLNFGLCNSTLIIPYINFTFKDESSLGALSASIPSFSVEYYLGDGTVNHTYTYINSTENPSYAFCVSPVNRSVYADYSIQYASTGYPPRTFNPSVMTLTNVTTNKTLYLLATADGLYITFVVVNNADQNIEDVAVNASRVIDGVNTVLGSGYTGADGAITFWLNPDYAHNFVFSHPSYPLYSTTITPTQESYTITLGGSTTTDVTDYHQGISYNITPLFTELINGTSYSFNFSITSTYWSLSSFGFNITNDLGTNVGSSSGTTSGGGVVSLTLNTGTNETFLMTAYWVINNQTVYVTRSWYITERQSDYSIAHMVQDFLTYKGQGLFGLDDFGLGILSFFIILGVTGAVKLKHGTSDIAVLVGIVFALVALLDISFGLIPNPTNAVDHFPTILMGLVFAGFLFKEVYQ